MQLIFTLTCFACVFLLNYKTNGQENEYTKQLIVTDAGVQCGSGWHKGHQNCNKQKVWLLKHSHKLSGEVSKEIQNNGNVDACIYQCTLLLDSCSAATINRNASICYLMKTYYEFNNSTTVQQVGNWVAIESLCCDILNPRKLSTNPNHNLPIIFNPQTDCQSGSRTSECSKKDKVWHVKENIGFSEHRSPLAFVQLVECMNQCINSTDCIGINQMSQWEDKCFLHDKNMTEGMFENVWNSYLLECCNVKNHSLWQGRNENLMILYYPKNVCRSFYAYLEKPCEDNSQKVWAAFEGAAPDVFYKSKSVDKSKIATCLNECLNDENSSKCQGVSIGIKTCYFHNKTIHRLNYGHHMLTTFHLICCTMS